MELESSMEHEKTENKPEELLKDKNDTDELTEVKNSSNGNGIVGKPSVTLKQQPDVLCNCPLQCNKKINLSWRKLIYEQFGKLVEHATQNLFIQRHIKIKSNAKQFQSDEKIQKRATCKYLIPMNGSVLDSLRYAKKLSFDAVKFHLVNQKELLNKLKNNTSASDSGEIQTDFLSTLNTLPTTLSTELNGHSDSVSEVRKAETCDANSPMSFNDSDSVNTSLDDLNGSEGENSTPKSVKYIEVCQKAFMNTYGITEKRIRWQREKLILRSRLVAEQKQKEQDEHERTLSLARNLGAGCQPLYSLMEKSNCLHLSSQLIGAIEDDVAMVDNFFQNQLWKPEDMMNKSLNVSSLELDSIELECD